MATLEIAVPDDAPVEETGLGNGRGTPPSSKEARFRQEALVHIEELEQRALHLTSGDEARAQDLVQDTLLKAYEAWESYEEGTNCRSWLFTILKNQFISGVRKRKCRPRLLSYDADSEDRKAMVREAREDDPARDVLNHIVADEVLSALEKLPEEFRITLVLSDLRDLRYQEISEQLNIPVGTVKSRVFRARRQLRDLLQAYAMERGYAS